MLYIFQLIAAYSIKIIAVCVGLPKKYQRFENVSWVYLCTYYNIQTVYYEEMEIIDDREDLCSDFWVKSSLWTDHVCNGIGWKAWFGRIFFISFGCLWCFIYGLNGTYTYTMHSIRLEFVFQDLGIYFCMRAREKSGWNLFFSFSLLRLLLF